jgi:Flp pilus assembly protein TadD
MTPINKLAAIVLLLTLVILPTSGQQTAEEWLNQGIALGNQGKFDEAIQAFDEAIRINPQLAEAWNNKSNALKQLNRTTEADAAYAKARELGYAG